MVCLMNFLIITTLIFYLLSTAGYIIYLFLQKDRLYKAGYYLLAIGFLCHAVLVCAESFISGHIPVHNLRGTLLVAGLTIAGVFIVFQYKFKLKILGVYVAPLTASVIFIASQLPDTPMQQINNVFNSVWLISHIVAIFIGEASFALACGIGIIYLVQERSIKNKTQGFFFRRLPSLELIDNTGYRCIIIGFIVLSVGLITGFVYAKFVWGRFWSWDPKEIWSMITWLLYAALLHGRISTGWRGRKAAIMSIVGFAVLLFTFFGVNFLMEGHHGGFTRF